MSGHSVDVLKWAANRTPEQVNLYATIGASAHTAAGHSATHRLEFYTGLRPAQDQVARPLALLVMEVVLNRTELGHGHSVSFPEPLWEGTEMSGFLLLKPDTPIVPALDIAGGLHVDYLQAIPAYSSEISLRTLWGIDRLLQRWKEAGVAFWDPMRPPSLTRFGR